MNLAIFASSFAPHIGGVEELVAQLSRELQDRGNGVIVVTNRWPPDLPEYEEIEGTSVYRLPMRIPGGGWRAQLRFYLTHRRIERQARSIARAHRSDLVHVQCVSTNGYYASHVARQLGLPLVVTSQGERTMDATNVFARSRGHNAVLRDLLEHADAVTACSRETLEDLEHYMDACFDDRGGVVYNGVGIQEFESDTVGAYGHASPYVLGIGRWVPQKGFDTLVRAFAEAVRDDRFAHDLVLAGDGSERARLQALVSALDVTDRVHLFGRADRSMAISLFKGCSFFALPSRYEPLGIVNLEAMAASKAVVATAVGGVPEVVHHEQNGLLIPPDDTQALAGAIKRVAKDEGLRLRLGKAGRAYVEAFSWPRIASQYEAVYAAARSSRRAADTA